MRPLLFPTYCPGTVWRTSLHHWLVLRMRYMVIGRNTVHPLKCPTTPGKLFFPPCPSILFLFNNYLFLAVWGLSCSMQALLLLVGLAAPWHLGSWLPTRDQTHVLCIGRQIPNHWTTREGPCPSILNTDINPSSYTERLTVPSEKAPKMQMTLQNPISKAPTRNKHCFTITQNCQVFPAAL